MSVADRDPIPDSIRDQAASWLARNQGDHPEVGDAEFRDWLSRDLRHRLAYAEADRAWRDSLFLANTRTGRERTLARAPLHMRRTTHLVAASLAVGLCVGLVSVHFVQDAPSFGIGAQVEARSFQTAPGETRTWQLSDGSTLTLSESSLAKSHFDGGRRRIELVQGRAHITVASVDSRPLEVRAAALSISTHDAAFDISSMTAANRVEVLSGRLQATVPGGSVQSLTAGQGMTAPQATTPGPAAQNTNPSMPIQGTAEGTIADAVQQLNRRNVVQIRLEGGAIASRRLAGAFRVDEPEAFAAAVAALGDLRLERSPGAIVLRPR
jgi:transmembrane sensor